MTLPFTLKKYLNAKEELWKLKYFHDTRKHNLPKKKKKKSSKRNPKASRYHNSLTNLKFQQKFQNIIIFQKTWYKKNRPTYLVQAKIP